MANGRYQFSPLQIQSISLLHIHPPPDLCVVRAQNSGGLAVAPWDATFLLAWILPNGTVHLVLCPWPSWLQVCRPWSCGTAAKPADLAMFFFSLRKLLPQFQSSEHVSLLPLLWQFFHLPGFYLWHAVGCSCGFVPCICVVFWGSPQVNDCLHHWPRQPFQSCVPIVVLAFLGHHHGFQQDRAVLSNL